MPMPTSIAGRFIWKKAIMIPRLKNFTKAVTLKPDFTEAYHNRGQAYAEKGDYDKRHSRLYQSYSPKT